MTKRQLKQLADEIHAINPNTEAEPMIRALTGNVELDQTAILIIRGGMGELEHCPIEYIHIDFDDLSCRE